MAYSKQYLITQYKITINKQRYDIWCSENTSQKAFNTKYHKGTKKKLKFPIQNVCC
jgi:hypothetical protein